MTTRTSWTIRLSDGFMDAWQVEEIADAIQAKIASQQASAAIGANDRIWLAFRNREECADWLADGDWDAGEEINLEHITDEWKSSCYDLSRGGRVNPNTVDEEATR